MTPQRRPEDLETVIGLMRHPEEETATVPVCRRQIGGRPVLRFWVNRLAQLDDTIGENEGSRCNDP
jgi:hypothetical protein